jgi:hypothetical protein
MLVAIQNGFSQEIPFVLQGPAGLSAHEFHFGIHDFARADVRLQKVNSGCDFREQVKAFSLESPRCL